MTLQLIREDAFKPLCCLSAPCPRLNVLVAPGCPGPLPPGAHQAELVGGRCVCHSW